MSALFPSDSRRKKPNFLLQLYSSNILRDWIQRANFILTSPLLSLNFWGSFKTFFVVRKNATLDATSRSAKMIARHHLVVLFGKNTKLRNRYEKLLVNLKTAFFHSARNRTSKITKFQLLRLFKFRYSRSHSHLDTPPWAVATLRISENEKAFNDKIPAAGHFIARTEQRASMVQNSAQ